MNEVVGFDRASATGEALDTDVAVLEERIVAALRRQVGMELHRGGAVVAISGGVDSAVCAGLAARAFGARHVLGVAMPEQESESQSVALARQWAGSLGIEFVVEDITAVLAAAGCYSRRDDAVRRLVPGYGPGWRCKIVLDSGNNGGEERLQVWQLVVQSPTGALHQKRLGAREYREIVAATNCKQRVRALMAYQHADRLGYAVIGTANRVEHDQGFFVKGGDGLADVKPIAHLYKQQVYRLAERLGVTEAIRTRTPTTDTYSLAQTQEEFFFSLPLAKLDAALAGRNGGRAASDVANETGMTVADVERTYRQIDRKRAATRYLHTPALLVEPVPEVQSESAVSS
jgi:NAD+ synthase